MYDIIILSGVSCVGKSFLIRQTIQKYDWLCQAPSVTTRKPRIGVDESDSRIFMSEYEFESEAQRGNLIFINTVFGNQYAYRCSDIMDFIRRGKTVFLDMKIDTVSQVKRQFPRTFCIYIKTQTMNLETEIRLDRDSHSLRIKEAILEQKNMEQYNLYADKIDVLFENHGDEESVNRFYQLISQLRRTV